MKRYAARLLFQWRPMRAGVNRGRTKAKKVAAEAMVGAPGTARVHLTHA
jgi:hypothetical protein